MPRLVRASLATIRAVLLLASSAWTSHIEAGEPADSAAAEAPEIVLPRYEIEETRPENTEPERWLYGSVAGFEVLSSGSESQTKKLVSELQRFRIAVGAVWPDALRFSGPPLTLILCGPDHAFDAFAPYDPEDRGASTAAASRLIATRERAHLVVDLSRRWVKLVNDNDTRIVGGTSGAIDVGIDHYDELIRVYTRYLVRRPTPPPPAWLAEGLTQVIAGIKYDSRSISFGELAPSTIVEEGLRVTSRTGLNSELGASRNSSDERAEVQDSETPDTSSRPERPTDFTGRRGGITMMPMEEFFKVREGSSTADLTLGGNWVHQAHAFVHLCIYGENGRFQKPFLTFVARIQDEPLTEALFTECFAMNYKKFAGFLKRYTASAWYKSARFDLQRGKLPEPEPPDLREATRSEIACIRADALLQVRGEDTAFLALSEAYRTETADPALLAALGLVEARRGKVENAMPLLEVATRESVARPAAYTELARLKLSAVQPPESTLSKAQLAAVLRPLFAARKIRPAIPDTYALIAQAWERSATPPTKENLAVLLEGAALFPSESDMLLRAAQLHQKIGCLREAGALADLGATWARDPAKKAALTTLKTLLPPEARVDLSKSPPTSPAKKSR